MIPTITGMYGILAHHSNMISAIVPGTLSYQLPGQPKQIAAVSAGLVKVEDNDVLILADSIERPEEIDENRACRSLAAAKEALPRSGAFRNTRWCRQIWQGPLTV